MKKTNASLLFSNRLAPVWPLSTAYHLLLNRWRPFTDFAQLEESALQMYRYFKHMHTLGIH